jgi:hypothetical protein
VVEMCTDGLGVHATAASGPGVVQTAEMSAEIQPVADDDATCLEGLQRSPNKKPIRA